MPFFTAVGHIDDDVFPTRELVMREYRRRFSLAAYHKRRHALVSRLGGVCELCAARLKACNADWAVRVTATPPLLSSSEKPVGRIPPTPEPKRKRDRRNERSGAVLVWRDARSKARARKLGLRRVNQLTTASAAVRERCIAEGLVMVLCITHAQRSFRGGDVKHGAWYAAYKKKCQCEDCEQFRLNYALERREKRREKSQQVANWIESREVR